MVEHARLLDYIQRGLCKLEAAQVPERDPDFFKPYILESTEFEFLEIHPNMNIMDKRILEEMRTKNKVLRMEENIKIYPVRGVFERYLKEMKKLVMAMKLKVDLIYFFNFSEISKGIVKGFYNKVDIVNMATAVLLMSIV
jgi:hypothetical protein